MNKLNNKEGVKPSTAKKLLSALVVTTSFMTMSAQAADNTENYKALSKQLTIMNSIFKSSFQAQDNKALRSAKVDSLYLANQGVVFTVTTTNSYFLNSHGYSFVMPDIVAPIAPVPPVGGDVDIEFFSDDEEIIIRMESEHEEHIENYRDLHEQQRELAYELRDIARENKDLTYQLRNVEKAEQAKLKAEQKALVKQKKELEKVKVRLEKKSKEMKAKKQQQQQKRLKQRTEQYALLSTSLIDTLCSYGNSLKALPNDEHISLIIKSAGKQSERKGYNDQVYVFNKKDILACSSDKISSEKLISKANKYQF